MPQHPHGSCILPYLQYLPMKKILILLAFLASAEVSALCQSNPPLTIRTVDGTVRRTNATQLRFPNSSLSCASGVCTYTAGAGSGDVVGPASSTDNALARFDSTTGKLLQNSAATLSDAGALNVAAGTQTAPSLSFSSDTGTGFYESGGTLRLSLSGTNRYSWTSSTFALIHSSGTINFGSAADVGVTRAAAGTLRATNASTGAGNLIIGTSAGAIGTSGAGVLAFTLSTAPSSSPTDTVQAYSGDAAAGAHELYTRNEAGAIERQTGLAARNSAAFDVTSSTTLAAVTGLTRNVEASRVYAFRAYLQTTANVAGGVKFAVSGTATATAISYEGVLTSGGALVAQARSTALDGVVCASTTTTAGTCEIEGVIVVNAAGTLTIQFAQNNSDAGASSVLANQYFQLIPIS